MDKKELRKFGIIFTLVLCFWGAVMLKHHNLFGYKMFFLAVLPLALAIVRPAALAPLHKALAWVGDKLGMLLTGLVLVMVFYLAVTPMAMLARWRKKSFMAADIDRDVSSYWIKGSLAQNKKAGYTKQY